ncbi:MAG: metallophosphatase domain-containing protein [Saprospiraceae bacterium]
MKFVAISDTHGCHRQLTLPKGDVLLHAGDVCNQGNREEVADFLVWMSELDFEHKILIRGNHDFDLIKQVSLLDIEMPFGVLQLDHSGIEINGNLIWGVPSPLDWKNRTWDSIPEQTQILITHQPPYSILDLTPSFISRGEKGLLEKVKQVQPKVHLFGHIHASYGKIEIDNTLFLNASGFKASENRIVNAPFVFEL